LPCRCKVAQPEPPCPPAATTVQPGCPAHADSRGTRQTRAVGTARALAVRPVRYSAVRQGSQAPRGRNLQCRGSGADARRQPASDGACRAPTALHAGSGRRGSCASAHACVGRQPNRKHGHCNGSPNWKSCVLQHPLILPAHSRRPGYPVPRWPARRRHRAACERAPRLLRTVSRALAGSSGCVPRPAALHSCVTQPPQREVPAATLACMTGRLCGMQARSSSR
jgi:hypothetical protein